MKIEERITLEKLQKTQVEILNVIDAVCRKYNLHYSLYAGTLLGAVRHNGFIPWDDDIDICMPRDDYERFLSVWTAENVCGYILQNKRNTPAFTQSFTKLRKDNTCFLQEADIPGAYHHGIFVDIFPVDRIPMGSINKAVFIWSALKYQLFMREFTPEKCGIVTNLVSKVVLTFSTPKSRKRYIRHFEERLIKSDSNSNNAVIFIETLSTLKKSMSSALLDEYTELKFGDRTYMCFSQWDMYLRAMYGDYMKLPPVEEREWKHRPLIIDFEKNYE